MSQKHYKREHGYNGILTGTYMYTRSIVWSFCDSWASC